MINTVARDPLFRVILIFLSVFIIGMLVTNEQARSIFLSPFAA